MPVTAAEPGLTVRSAQTRAKGLPGREARPERNTGAVVMKTP